VWDCKQCGCLNIAPDLETCPGCQKPRPKSYEPNPPEWGQSPERPKKAEPKAEAEAKPTDTKKEAAADAKS
jgi:hypothetical protein